jgi:hypothetical protein
MPWSCRGRAVVVPWACRGRAVVTCATPGGKGGKGGKGGARGGGAAVALGPLAPGDCAALGALPAGGNAVWPQVAVLTPTVVEGVLGAFGRGVTDVVEVSFAPFRVMPSAGFPLPSPPLPPPSPFQRSFVVAADQWLESATLSLTAGSAAARGG